LAATIKRKLSAEGRQTHRLAAELQNIMNFCPKCMHLVVLDQQMLKSSKAQQQMDGIRKLISNFISLKCHASFKSI